MMRALRRSFVMCLLALGSSSSLGACLGEDPERAPAADEARAPAEPEEESDEPVGSLDLQPEAIDAFYVSLTGNDSNPGSLEQPFRSLERARDAVRQRLSANPGAAIT